MITESKVKVTFGTSSLKHCGYDTDLSFVPHHFETAQIRLFMTRGGILLIWGLRPRSKFIHMCAMIRTWTTLILGHGIKGQGQLWYFVFETLLARNRLVSMRRPEWFAGAFTICNWIVRPSFCLFIYPFVRYFPTLTS